MTLLPGTSGSKLSGYILTSLYLVTTIVSKIRDKVLGYSCHFGAAASAAEFPACCSGRCSAACTAGRTTLSTRPNTLSAWPCTSAGGCSASTGGAVSFVLFAVKTGGGGKV